MLKALLKNFTAPKKVVVKKSDIARGYAFHPSITDYLPWKDYSEKHKVFLLSDNKSLGVCFSLTPIACEARPAVMMEEIAKTLREAIKNAIPCEKENPWILQFFVERKSDLSPQLNHIKEAIKTNSKSPHAALVQAHSKILEEHFAFVSRPGGIFFDDLVTNQVFCGGFLNVTAVLYKIASDKPQKESRRNKVGEIVTVARKFSDQLRTCGLRVKRLRGEQFYHWLLPWFNPRPKQTNGDVAALRQKIVFPSDAKKPFGWDLTEQLFFTAPESTESGWLFDGLPHKVLTIQSLTTEPAIGHITAERQRGSDGKLYNLIDRLPEDSVFSMTVVMQSQSEVELHLKTIQDSAVGFHEHALLVKEEIRTAEKAIANGDLLLPIVMAVYLRGEDIEDLAHKEAETEVLLNSNGFKVITDSEVFPIDAYLRYLPMCYDFHFDQKNNFRSRYFLLSDVVKLLPFYGRGRGTDNPGLIAFNRGGEPWFYDVYRDRCVLLPIVNTEYYRS